MLFSQQPVAAHATARPQYAGRMQSALARAVSILGHPMVVLPLAALALAARTMPLRQVIGMAIGFALFAMLVMGWSWWQVRRGHWAHVDASHRQERRTLNRFLLVALLCAAVLALLSGLPRAFALGLSLAASLIAMAQLTARWCKLSLHLAFVVYAALLLWQVAPLAGIAGLVFALLVAWSRLVLERHTRRDIIAGAMTGAFAGLAFAGLAPQLPA